ncbi:MAG: alpha-L-arabinofuranosidase C-terminal domain-containing protein [Bryobacteraceae bacterium]|jgi:alpha-N-arabinofuranosidase
MEKLTRRRFVKAAGATVMATGRLHGFQPGAVAADLAAPAVRFNRMLFGQYLDAIALLEAGGFKGRIKIAFDEWNLRGWHHPGFPGGGAAPDLIARRAENDRNETYTMADAVFSAGLLNACLRHAEDVQMACMAPVVNARGPLFVHPKGIVRRTTFHVLRMYSDLLEPNVLAVRTSSEPLKSGEESVPALDAVVTCSDDRKRFAVALVNRHPDRQIDCKLDLSVMPRDGAVKVRLLAGDSPDAYNDVDRPDRVVPETREWKLRGGAVQLPPHSVSIVQASI